MFLVQLIHSPYHIKKASLQLFRDLEVHLQQMNTSSFLTMDEDDDEIEDENDDRSLAQLQQEAESLSLSIHELQNEQLLIQSELDQFEHNKAALEVIPKIFKEENSLS